jgi:hypothetical protein
LDFSTERLFPRPSYPRILLKSLLHQPLKRRLIRVVVLPVADSLPQQLALPRLLQEQKKFKAWFGIAHIKIESPGPMVGPQSGGSAIEAHNKVGYLQHLEIPFFIGVVSQLRRKITIRTTTAAETLWTPRLRTVSTFGAMEDRSSLQAKVDLLNAVCKRASSHIATRRAEEHIYETDADGHLVMVAGIGSVQYFRNNFCRRLAEVFYNLHWIFVNQRAAFRMDKFSVYGRLYKDLQKFPHRRRSML